MSIIAHRFTRLLPKALGNRDLRVDLFLDFVFIKGVFDAGLGVSAAHVFFTRDAGNARFGGAAGVAFVFAHSGAAAGFDVAVAFRVGTKAAADGYARAVLRGFYGVGREDGQDEEETKAEEGREAAHGIEGAWLRWVNEFGR